MSDSGKRLIASANEALDLVKRLRYEADGSEFSNRYADMAGQAADRIEQLERELAAERDMVNQLAGDLGDALSDLTAEKALADRLYKAIESAYVDYAEDEAEFCAALEAYRKARGLQ